MTRKQSTRHTPRRRAGHAPASERVDPKARQARLLLEFAPRGAAADPKVQLASSIGQVVASTILMELFTDAQGETASPDLDFISGFRDLRRKQVGSNVQCVRVSAGLAAAPGPTFWTLSPEASGVEDPWLFADSVTSRVGEILDGGKFLLPGQHSDLYVGGHHFITHDGLARHVAGQVEGIRVPRSDIDLAATVVHLGSAITWAVTGGNLPRVDFSHTQIEVPLK